MRKTLCIAILALLSTRALLAQCDSCNVDTSYKAQYCHKDPLFPTLCAAFNEDKKYFLLKSEKKTKQVPYGKEDPAYFLSLAQDRSLKIDAEALLFLQTALLKWKLEARKIGYTFRESGLGIKTIVEGTGELPENNKPVRVHYVGYLEDGTKFDSSYDRDTPIEFTLGTGRVIKGWDEGIATLRKGTKAWLYIPSKIAYGDAGKPPTIPAKATLIFQVEVLEE